MHTYIPTILQSPTVILWQDEPFNVVLAYVEYLNWLSLRSSGFYSIVWFHSLCHFLEELLELIHKEATLPGEST